MKLIDVHNTVRIIEKQMGFLILEVKVRLLFRFQGVVSKLHLQFGYPRRRKYAGFPEGDVPFGSGFSVGASSIPVGTRLSLESRVCYTFVEQMAAGIVARPGKCGYSCGVLAGKVAPCGAA